MLVSKGVDREIEAALSDRVELPSGGHLNIQPTEALTVIDVNSGRFTSSRTQAETVRRTNLEAAQEISRQLRLRNIGGMVIVDFIDMDSRKDQQQVLEIFQRALEEDRAKPQIGQLSDLGLVELTRRRQGQSLRELFTVHCTHCHGIGVTPTLEIGHGTSRTVISFRSADEENSKSGRQNQRRNSSQNRGGSVLRAATAMGGRVVPTVDVEEPQESFDDAMPFVPEDILDQVPDDLLDDKHSKQALKHGAFNRNVDDEDEGGEDVVESEEVVELHTENFAPPTSIVEESLVEDDSAFHELDESISAVERVFNEMGESQANDDEDVEHESTETIIVIDTDAERPVLTEHSDSLTEEPHESHDSSAETSSHEAHHEVAAEPEVEEEPATEIDPITGIYRLKPKAKPEDEQHEESAHSYRDSSGNGSEDSAFQSAFTNSSVNYEKPFESSSFGQETEQGSHESESKEGDYTQLTLTVPAPDETHFDNDTENQDQ